MEGGGGIQLFVDDVWYSVLFDKLRLQTWKELEIYLTLWTSMEFKMFSATNALRPGRWFDLSTFPAYFQSNSLFRLLPHGPFSAVVIVNIDTKLRKLHIFDGRPSLRKASCFHSAESGFSTELLIVQWSTQTCEIDVIHRQPLPGGIEKSELLSTSLQSELKLSCKSVLIFFL